MLIRIFLFWMKGVFLNVPKCCDFIFALLGDTLGEDQRPPSFSLISATILPSNPHPPAEEGILAC